MSACIGTPRVKRVCRSLVDWARSPAPQRERVSTVENTADSRTEWTDRRGGVRSTGAAPNSLIVVRAEAALQVLCADNEDE